MTAERDFHAVLPTLTTEPVLDLDDLSARCMGKTELVERILGNLVPTLGADIAELDRGFDEQDLPSIVTLSHRVKGTAANVAAKRFELIAAGLEAAAREGQPLSELTEYRDVIHHEYRLLSDKIESRSTPDGEIES